MPKTADAPHVLQDDPRISALFHAVLHQHGGQRVSLGKLVDSLEGSGFGVLLLLFSLPLCVPIPKPPPLDFIFGVPLYYLCGQMVMGRARPALPRKILKREISTDFLLRAFTRARGLLERFERMFHPRLTGLSDKSVNRVCGVLGIGLTTSVMVPFPMSNLVPSLCMAVMAMGILSRDRLAALAGGIFGTLWVAGLIAIVAIGAHTILRWL
ncbi:MAG: exopolysaccharide biosynthesis protein [Rhodospirillales bacterium]|nr:exopolysaccharide biosynthesis protein [Alphaproteobacteria bacterium]MCB9986225.1 exopolysaccharide biosynthesis protein [Rhodospirillales bacterium]USO07219.1 MAG: exopolysaccharide biosynthesis protein [Rhodospirillales bacterium]